MSGSWSSLRVRLTVLEVWRQRPRAVILDLFMPRLGGLGALDRIRRMDASIAVIIISGVGGLLDIRMPGLSGVEVLRRIKTLPVATSVVMVSGIEDVQTARQTLALGAADYVAKPVDFAYLDSVLDAHLLMGHFGAG